jgi:predicted DNA-binding mobile mystery protein A
MQVLRLPFAALWVAQDDWYLDEKGDGMRTKMRTKGWEERLRELDEAGMAFLVARGTARNVQGSGQGWLRTVRRAVGVPVAEAAGRMGVVPGDVFRMENAEGQGVIGLQTLRRAAEALGCELVYGLTPKEGTLAAMAAAIEAGLAQKRVEARARRLVKAKDQRREAARKSWRAQQRELQAAQWREYWRLWGTEMPASMRRRIPKAVKQTPWWREQMRKEIKKALRKEGFRLR